MKRHHQHHGTGTAGDAVTKVQAWTSAHDNGMFMLLTSSDMYLAGELSSSTWTGAGKTVRHKAAAGAQSGRVSK